MCVCTDVLCCNVSLSVLHQIHKDTMLPKHRWKECPCNLGFMVCTCQLGRWNKAVKTLAVCWRPKDTTDHFHKVWPRKFIQEVSYTNKKSILFIRNLLNIQDFHYLRGTSCGFQWVQKPSFWGSPTPTPYLDLLWVGFNLVYFLGPCSAPFLVYQWYSETAISRPLNLNVSLDKN